MQIGPRHVVALLSWGITAVMMHPSFASLIAMLVNAVLLALLVYSPSNKVKRHA